MIYDELPSHAKEIYYKARQRARLRRLEFSLAREEFAELWDKAGGRCAISGIRFELEPQGHRKKRPFAPSLDRIESRHGYVVGNLRFVCVAANFAMNAWGEATLRRLAEGVCGIQDAPGVWSPPMRGSGTALRRLKNGRCSYEARILVRGKMLGLGSYPSRTEAAERVRRVRSSLATGEFAPELHTQNGRAP